MWETLRIAHRVLKNETQRNPYYSQLLFLKNAVHTNSKIIQLFVDFFYSLYLMYLARIYSRSTYMLEVSSKLTKSVFDGYTVFKLPHKSVILIC